MADVADERAAGDMNGLRAWSAERVQEDTMASVARHVPSGAAVLELGAGTGRLSRMLRDAGYRVVAGDWRDEAFVPRDIECRKVDCDDAGEVGRIFGGERYAAVVCGDLIEHLKNPFAFIQSVAGLLAENGHVFVTTPNILSPTSRVNILVNGNANSFGPMGLEIGHINPLFPSVLNAAFRCAGLEPLECRGAGRVRRVEVHSFRGWSQWLLSVLLRFLMRKVVDAPVLLCVGRAAQTGGGFSGGPVGTGTGGCYR